MTGLDSKKIIGGGRKADRKPMDFYPTPPEATDALYVFLSRENLMTPGDRIWEPACGDGAISRYLIAKRHAVFSSDIRTDSGYGWGGLDFLQTADRTDCDWIITNPPFNVSEAFIDKCLSLDVPFALLLKSQYWHGQRRHKLFYKRTPYAVCPLCWRPDFTGGGSSLMDMAWTVWTTKNELTRYKPLRKPQ